MKNNKLFKIMIGLVSAIVVVGVVYFGVSYFNGEEIRKRLITKLQKRMKVKMKINQIIKKNHQIKTKIKKMITTVLIKKVKEISNNLVHNLSNHRITMLRM